MTEVGRGMRVARHRGALRRASFAGVAVLVVVGLSLDACGQAPTPAPASPATSPSLAASEGPAASLPASPVDGVIIAVDASSLSDVRGFTLLLPGGARIDFRLGALDNPTEFPPGHLMEHQATSEPIRVYFRVEGGVPVVYRLGDAPGPSPSAT